MSYRILLLTPYLESQRGNSLTAARLASGLNKAGLQVEVIAMEYVDWPQRAAAALGAYRVNLLHGLNATSVGKALTTLPELQELPLLITMTGTDLNFGLTDILTAKAMAKAQRLVVFNDYYLDCLGSQYQEWGQKARVIPQGVHLETITARSSNTRRFSSDQTVFILISGLRPVKNIELALDGLAQAYEENQNLQLLLVGSLIDEYYAEIIQSRIAKLPWACYLGELPHEEMEAVINQADVVLNTSHSEGQPLAVLEAMSLGLPCLLSAVPGNLGLITDGQEGYYFTSASDLAARALLLMASSAHCQAMGLAAQRLTEKYHQPEREINSYVDLYTEILNELPGSEVT